MKFYSEVTKKLYNSEEACNQDELKVLNAKKAKANEYNKTVAKYIKECLDAMDAIKKAETVVKEKEKEGRQAIERFLNKYSGDTMALIALTEAIEEKLSIKILP